ncbi:hypothetical protein VB10N_29540 [Vibrio sp. 10N]|nr:hypothetical protein VB10N_29540 [Vibrio sp. 10N]
MGGDYSGEVKRDLGSMVLWSYGPMVLWSYGPMVLWSYGPMVLWSYGSYKKTLLINESVTRHSPQGHRSALPKNRSFP